MEWLITIAVGFVAGALGKLLMPGDDPGGCIVTTLIGIAGAIVGKFIAGQFGLSAEDVGKTFSLASIGISVGGVILLLLIYRLIIGGKKEDE